MRDMTVADVDLLLFDVDGTIAPQFEKALDSQARDFFHALSRRPLRPHVALVSNQGGVALRLWMENDGFGEPENFPAIEDVQQRMQAVVSQIPLDISLYVSYAFQTKSTRRWAPTPIEYVDDPAWARSWRKPNPGMIQQAMEDAHVADPSRVLFVGDMKTDQEAARRAGVHFMYARRFWQIAPEFLGVTEVV